MADKPTSANGPPKYKSREDLHTTTQNLANEPTLANGPPQNRGEMYCIPVHLTWQTNLLWPMELPSPPFPMGTREEKPWIPLHKTWQTNILWPMNPTVTRAEMNCITLHKSWQMTLLWPMAPLPSTRPDIPEYQYTKLGRQMYFWQWPSQVPEQRWLAYHYTELGRGNYFGQWTPHHPLGTREEKPWIPLHKTWQTNLLWPMELPSTRTEMPCIPVHQTLQINLCWLIEPPGTRAEMICLPLHKLGRWPYCGWWPLDNHSRDALNTNTKNLAEKAILANGPHSTRAGITWIPLHKTWQMNLLWPMAPRGTRAKMTYIPLHKTWQMSLIWPMPPWL